MWSSEWHSPAATVRTRTSSPFGPSRSTSVTSPFPGWENNTAAFVFIVSSDDGNCFVSWAKPYGVSGFQPGAHTNLSGSLSFGTNFPPWARPTTTQRLTSA